LRERAVRAFCHLQPPSPVVGIVKHLKTLDLSYFLPTSRFRVSSSVTTTWDTILEPTGVGRRVPETTVALEIGPSERSRTLKVPAGWFRNAGASFSLTDEGLLVSSAVESSGQLGKVLIGAVGVAATVAGAMVSPAGALGAAAGALYIAKSAEDGEKAPEDPPEKREADAFEAQHPQAAALRGRLTTAIASLENEAIGLAEKIANPPEGESATDLYRRLRKTQAASQILQAKLDRVNDLFKTWRATTIHTSTTQYERLLTLAEVRKAQAEVDDAGQLQFAADAPQRVKSAWRDFGMALAVDEVLPETEPGEGAPGEAEILVRKPRMVTVNLYEKGAGDKAVLKESKPHLVMDSHCEVTKVELRESVWAKRSVTVGFSDLGALKSYAYQADSTAAAIAETASALPGTATASLENVLKAREALGSLESSDVKQELAKVKAEVELKQQELAREGLKATSADYATLERLKQRAATLEQRKAIRGLQPAETDPVAAEIAELKQKVELLTLRAKAAWLD